MIKSVSVNLVSGALLGYSYFAVLAIVMSLPVLPTQLYVSSLWMGAVFESVISLLITCLVFGTLVCIGIKRFVSLAPLVAAAGFLTGAVIFQIPIDWFAIESSLGKGIFALRLGELITGASLLAAVWWYIGRGET